MQPLRIVHVADAHLDTSFYGPDAALRRKLRDACQQAFKAAVDLAIRRRAHALLIAGDLFDDGRLCLSTERFLLGEMARLKEARIAVFYATGNQDPGRASHRAQQMESPDNVRLFTSIVPETVAVADAQGQQVGWLTAAGHNSPHETANLAERFGASGDSLPHVALLHAHVLGAAGSDRHEPCAACRPGDLAGRGFDYWALGHIHVHQKVVEDAPAWYAGNLQGRNPAETGLKGVLYVKVEKGRVSEPEFIPLASVVWDLCEVQCPVGAQSLAALSAELGRELRRCIELDDGREHLVRMDLLGQSHLAAELGRADRLRELTDAVQNETGLAWLEIRPLSVARPMDLDRYGGSGSMLAEVRALLDRLKADDALLDRIRPEELARTDVRDARQYLRSLLNRMDADAASLLVSDKDR